MAVVILGASSIIGRAISERFARGGFDLILHGWASGEALGELVSALKAKYATQRFEICLADLASQAGQEQLLAAVTTKLIDMKQDVDCIVISQSTFERSTLKDVSREALRHSLALHVEAPIFILQGLLPFLKKDLGSCVIFMLDSFLNAPMPGRLAYVVAKSAAVGLVKNLAGELKGRARVNGVAPGIITWPGGFTTQDKEKVLAKIPVGRAGAPDEIANAVFFAGIEASYMNGEILVMDGGRSAVP
jgi:pteridine reductase